MYAQQPIDVASEEYAGDNLPMVICLTTLVCKQPRPSRQPWRKLPLRFVRQGYGSAARCLPTTLAGNAWRCCKAQDAAARGRWRPHTPLHIQVQVGPCRIRQSTTATDAVSYGVSLGLLNQDESPGVAPMTPLPLSPSVPKISRSTLEWLRLPGRTAPAPADCLIIRDATRAAKCQQSMSMATTKAAST